VLSKLQIQTLLRACQDESGVLARTKAAELLASTLGFGRIAGRRWLVARDDRARIESYLLTVERVDPATDALAWDDADRIGATRLGANEKLAGRQPREGRVALRAPGGIRMGGSQLDLPKSAYLDLRVSETMQLDHDALIVVENFEAFVSFEDACIETRFEKPLLVFRGDAVNTQDAVLSLLLHASLPVIAWPDFDPAGLLIAKALPHCREMIAPADPDEALVRIGRPDLYLAQLREMESTAAPGAWVALRDAVRRHRRGIDQERMIADRIPMRVWQRDR
jgi:hypothetical protein